MHKERFFTMAEAYDRVCRITVPLYDLFQEEALRITNLLPLGPSSQTPQMSAPIVVDLGAGSGIFLERALQLHPQARAYWVDYSDDFERVARRRLAPFGERVRFVRMHLEEAWEAEIAEAPQLIFSMSAIHHLTGGEKRALYARCGRLLAPGGWFLNVDEMRTLDRAAYRNSLHRWLQHVAACAANIPPEDRIFYERFCAHFENWRLRNVEGFDRPKVKGDDLHEGFVEQVAWLREAGLCDVDLFMKYHLWCMIGGRRAE